MRAHQVKCQICAPGVLVVNYHQAGENASHIAIVSANLTKDEAIDLVSRELAIIRTRQSEEAGSSFVFTPEQIKATHSWDVEKTVILSHL